MDEDLGHSFATTRHCDQPLARDIVARDVDFAKHYAALVQ